MRRAGVLLLLFPICPGAAFHLPGGAGAVRKVVVKGGPGEERGGSKRTATGSSGSGESLPLLKSSVWKWGDHDIHYVTAGERGREGEERGNTERAVAPADGGEHAPIILLHGFAASSFMWRYNVNALARRTGRKVYALDLLGFGKSDKPLLRSYHPRLWTQQVVDFLDYKLGTGAGGGRNKAILVGNSLGGYTALAAASQAGPELVSGCVLLNAFLRFGAEGRESGGGSVARASTSSTIAMPFSSRGGRSTGGRRTLAGQGRSRGGGGEGASNSGHSSSRLFQTSSSSSSSSFPAAARTDTAAPTTCTSSTSSTATPSLSLSSPLPLAFHAASIQRSSRHCLIACWQMVVSATFEFARRPSTVRRALREAYFDPSNVDDALVEDICNAAKHPHASQVFYRLCNMFVAALLGRNNNIDHSRSSSSSSSSSMVISMATASSAAAADRVAAFPAAVEAAEQEPPTDGSSSSRSSRGGGGGGGRWPQQQQEQHGSTGEGGGGFLGFQTVESLVSDLQVPLLLLWGARDKVVTRRTAEGVQRLYPRATRVDLDAGHCPQDEAPRAVNDQIVEWLADIQRGGGQGSPDWSSWEDTS